MNLSEQYHASPRLWICTFITASMCICLSVSSVFLLLGLFVWISFLCYFSVFARRLTSLWNMAASLKQLFLPRDADALSLQTNKQTHKCMGCWTHRGPIVLILNIALYIQLKKINLWNLLCYLPSCPVIHYSGFISPWWRHRVSQAKGKRRVFPTHLVPKGLKRDCKRKRKPFTNLTAVSQSVSSFQMRWNIMPPNVEQIITILNNGGGGGWGEYIWLLFGADLRSEL